MGLVKKVFDKVGETVDDKKWKSVERDVVEIEYWVRIFASNASKYQQGRGKDNGFWDEGIAYMTLRILGEIIQPPIIDSWDYPPDREDFPEPEFKMTYLHELIRDEEDQRIVDLGLRSSPGQNETPYKTNWFIDRRKMFELK